MYMERVTENWAMTLGRDVHFQNRSYVWQIHNLTYLPYEGDEEVAGSHVHGCEILILKCHC